VLSNRLYYQLKPYLPWRFRMALRRMMARRTLREFKDVWPINAAIGQTPVGWPGWPEGKKFAFVLTHDVEGPAGLAKCRQLVQLEQSLGFRSSFNFIPEGDYSVSRKLREDLTASGFEVGVHDLQHDGKLYESRRIFSEKARRINQYLAEWGAVGFRSGFMLHNLEWLQDLNVSYDTSTFDTDPFEPQPDGIGTIFPFWVPRPAGGGYVELPYTLPQDSTLFLLLKENSTAIWQQKLDWIVEHGGMAMLNVHPDYLRFENEASGPQLFPAEFYRKFLQLVKSKYAGLYWHVLPKEVASYVVQNKSVLNVAGNQQAVSTREIFISDQIPVATCAIAIPVASHTATTTQHLADSPAGTVIKSPVEIPNPISDQTQPGARPLHGKRAAVVLFSHYPSDPRPRRAAEALAAEGMTIDLICLQWNKTESRREKINGVNVFRVPMKRRRSGKLVYIFQYAGFFSISSAFLTVRSLNRRYDLVHVHNMPDFLAFSALVPKALGAKVILDLHDPMPELMVTIYDFNQKSLIVQGMKKIEKWSIGFADLVLTPNVAFKKLFASRSGPPEKIQIIMNSPSEEFFHFLPAPANVPTARVSDQSFTMLYHGSLVERHGLDIAVEALKLVRQVIPRASLVICGENTPYFERVMQQVQQLGLSDAVRYLGRRNLTQIAEAIAACDIGIIPNRHSVFTEINMPTRIFEYLALGKPVIAPRTRGICDYFNDENLLFFEPDNTTDLADKMLWAFHHAQEMPEIVRQGQAVYLKHRWSKERERLIALVTGLLGGDRSTGGDEVPVSQPARLRPS
jgi:glycosyltransferase involved in cell wall biosynthesis